MERLRELVFGSPAFIIAVLVAVTVALSLRAIQVWRQRRLFGLDPYTASRRRDWLRGWARAASVVTAVVGGLLLLAALSPGLFSSAPFSLAAALRLSTPTPTLRPVREVLEGPLNVTPFPTAVPIAGARLIVPRIGVDAPLIEAPIVGREWDISLLRDEVAHLGGTASVGESGNIVLAGHITIPGGGWGPFRELERMQPGDEIFIRNQDEVIRYEVTGLQIVAPDAVQIVFPTEEDRLTLITCADWDEELGTYTARIAVFAIPIPES
jgi:LPXTG-site transpeptidase (sortase) family protein